MGSTMGQWDMLLSAPPWFLHSLQSWDQTSERVWSSPHRISYSANLQRAQGLRNWREYDQKGGCVSKALATGWNSEISLQECLAKEENNLKLTVVLIFYLWVSILKLRMVITQKCSKSGIFNPKRTLFQRSDLIFPLTANGK